MEPPRTGDAYLRDWPDTLKNIAALDPQALVPGRGNALCTPETVSAAIDGTRAFIESMYAAVSEGRESGNDHDVPAIGLAQSGLQGRNQCQVPGGQR